MKEDDLDGARVAGPEGLWRMKAMGYRRWFLRKTTTTTTTARSVLSVLGRHSKVYGFDGEEAKTGVLKDRKVAMDLLKGMVGVELNGDLTNA